MKGRSRLVAIALMVLALVGSACSSGDETSESLVVLIDNDEGPITPANFNTFIGFWMVGWVYDPLFARSPDLEPVPALAEEANPSADGLTWEVTLRDDVEWHDGEPFTADDVAFSYNFLIEAGRAPNLAAIDTVEVTGDHSLTIRLSNPAPFFVDEGLAGYYIMPEHIWRDQQPVSGELNQFQGSVGTGPYRIDEIVAGESYTFSANKDYFRGEPKVETLIAKVVKDRTQQFTQLRTGAAQAVLASIPPAQVDQLADDEGIEILRGSDFFNYVFYANGSRAPFDIPEVRTAIARAIDTATLTETIFLGRGTQLPLNWYHPDLPWSENIEHEFDPDEAARLLDSAGIVDSDGDGVREFQGAPASFDILCDANNPAEVRSVELIGGWLADVGIEATASCIDIDTAVSRIWPNFSAIPDPDYDLAIWGWSA
ncbi:MAG: ABC transporter substrate-binding protein, partial [Acidimicrobiia bacterium]|nr:ABC transporter substrate-binding protein [Acidimicrobiia bacterium]